MIKRLRCTHAHLRCVHGDEINHLNGARIACAGCGAPLHGAMLWVCSETGVRHG